MSIDLEYLRWLAEQSESVLANVAPLVARLLGVDTQQVVDFVKFVATATQAVLDAIEAFLKFQPLFGAPGDGLTNESGCMPDCPGCPDCHQPVLWALKAECC